MIPNSIYWGDCLEVLRDFPEQSIDMVLTDPMYGVTAAKWDNPPNLDHFWQEHWRVLKTNGVVVVTAVQPFASQLVLSSKHFKYDLIWSKNKATGHLNAKKMPLRAHEHVLVFYRKLPTYNPQKTQGHKPVNKHTKGVYRGEVYGGTNKVIHGGGATDRYPQSVLRVPIVNNDSKERIHIFQKPVVLFEWLIKTFTNEGEVVLDSYLGSGTTAVAAINTGRCYVGIEIEKKFYEAAVDRIKKVVISGDSF